MSSSHGRRRRRAPAPPRVGSVVAGLASLPAGPELLGRLVGVDEAVLAGRESVHFLRAWQRMVNYAQARVVEAVAGLMVREDPGYGVVPGEELSGGAAVRFDEVACAEVRGRWWCRGRGPTGCVGWRRI